MMKILRHQQLMLSAQANYASAGGHTKAELNEMAVNRIKAKLNCEVPPDRILYSFGTFNGKGAV